jgi:hypothetical protein
MPPPPPRNRLHWRSSPPTRSIVRPLIGTATSIYLPAGSGAFAATVIGGMTQTGKVRIYARCRTYVPQTWMKPDQPLSRAADVENTVAIALWGWNRVGDTASLVTAQGNQIRLTKPTPA